MASFVLLTACEQAPATRLVRGELRARRVESLEPPPPGIDAPVAMPGDYVLEGPGVRVLVGGMQRVRAQRGALLEIVAGDVRRSEDPVVGPPMLYIRGRSARVRVTGVRVASRQGAPALRIVGVAEHGDGVVRITRDVALGRVRHTLALHTSLWTLSRDGVQRVRIGDRIHWGGDHPFLPGEGDIDDSDWHRTSWVGSDLGGDSMLLGPVRGGIRLRASFERHGGARFLEHTDVAYEMLNVPRASPRHSSVVIALSDLGLGQAARRWGWASRRALDEVWVHLPHRPPGAQVTARDSNGVPWLVARPDENGSVVLPLPVGTVRTGGLRLAATAYGHATSLSVPVTPGGPRRMRLEIPRGGHIQVSAVDRGTGHSIPARVRFVGLEGVESPELGPDHRVAGAGDTVVTVKGDTRVAVRPGRYRVWVTHGPEWSVHQEVVDVTESYGPRIRAALTHEVNPGEWIGADLHVHSAPSPDSDVSLNDRVESLLAEGVRFAIPTDHNHVSDFGPSIERIEDADMATVTGVEVTTWEPAYGHFNAFPFPLDPNLPDNGAPIYQGTSPAQLFDALHAVNPDVLVQVNHPRIEGGIGFFDVADLDPGTGWGNELYDDGFDLLEVFNGFDLARPEHTEQVFADWLGLLAQGQRVVATGNSDSHKVRYQLAGYPRTYIRVPDGAAGDVGAVLQSLREGRVFVSSGPILEVSVGGAGPGDTVAAKRGRVELRIRVRAPGWMDTARLEVFEGQNRVVDMPLRDRDRRGSVRFARSVNVAVAEDSFLVVRVSSPKSIADFFGRWGVLPLAFTNPLFIDADGDGVTRWDLPPPASPPAPLLDGGVSDGGAGDGAAGLLGQPAPRLTDAGD